MWQKKVRRSVSKKIETILWQEFLVMRFLQVAFKGLYHSSLSASVLDGLLMECQSQLQV